MSKDKFVENGKGLKITKPAPAPPVKK